MLGVVVIVHELGHYLAGRLFDAAVESYSVGFGKSIYERTDSRGTRWRVNRFPIGGFVKFVGESQLAGDVGKNEQGLVGKAFPDLGVGQRSIISLAGPMANFVLASLLFALMAGVNGKPRSDLSISQVVAETPAAVAGFEIGDILKTIEGKPIRNSNDFTMPIALGTGVDIPVELERDGELITVNVIPERRDSQNGLGQTVKIGTIGVQLSATNFEMQHYGPIGALREGVTETVNTLSVTVHMLGRMVTGKEPLSNLSGPVGIGDITRRAVNQTLGAEGHPLSTRLAAMMWIIIHLCALISVGIGLFNLLPLPVLDGGHLVFNAYEAVTGKVLPEKIQEASLTFGLVFLIGMAIIITWGDIIETGIFKGSGG
ncbi:MAG: site-2 protease family protein [Hyphomonadaceae bacterium]